MIASLDDCNADSNVDAYSNGRYGDRKQWNGSMVAHSFELLATYFTRPNQLRISVVDVGVGKCLIASRYLGSGSIRSSDILEPAKSTNL